MKAFQVMPNRADLDVHVCRDFFARDAFEKQSADFLFALGDTQKIGNFSPLIVGDQMGPWLFFPLPGVVVRIQVSVLSRCYSVSVPVTK